METQPKQQGQDKINKIRVSPDLLKKLSSTIGKTLPQPVKKDKSN